MIFLHYFEPCNDKLLQYLRIGSGSSTFSWKFLRVQNNKEKSLTIDIYLSMKLCSNISLLQGFFIVISNPVFIALIFLAFLTGRKGVQLCKVMLKIARSDYLIKINNLIITVMVIYFKGIKFCGD